jgi:hypothetical protein
MSYVFADKLGEKVDTSFEDPYSALFYRKRGEELCIVENGKVKEILLTRLILIKWVVLCAERALKIFEEYVPNDKRPLQAINAAKKWVHEMLKKGTTVDAEFVLDAAHAAEDAAKEAEENNYIRATQAAYAAKEAAIACFHCHVFKKNISSIYNAANVARRAVRAVEEKDKNKEKEWQRRILWILAVDPWYEFYKGYCDPKNQISRLPRDILSMLKEY